MDERACEDQSDDVCGRPVQACNARCQLDERNVKAGDGIESKRVRTSGQDMGGDSLHNGPGRPFRDVGNLVLQQERVAPLFSFFIMSIFDYILTH